MLSSNIPQSCGKALTVFCVICTSLLLVFRSFFCPSGPVPVTFASFSQWQDQFLLQRSLLIRLLVKWRTPWLLDFSLKILMTWRSKE